MAYGQPKILRNASDNQLLERYYQSGKHRFRNVLLHRYADKIMDSCAYFLNQREPTTAVDLAIEAILHLTIELDKRPKIEQISGWIFLVVRNFCFKKNRENKKLQGLMDNFSNNYPFEKVENPTDDTLYTKELQYDALLEAIEALSDIQQRCVHSFYWKQLSYKEISKVEDIPIKNVKSALQNARIRLRRQVDQI